jgi:hypothetical protein
MSSMLLSASLGSFTGGTRCSSARPSAAMRHTLTPAAGSLSAAPRSKLVIRRSVYTVSGPSADGCAGAGGGLFGGAVG